MPSQTRITPFLLLLVLAVLAFTRPAAAQTPNYSDIWYTPGEEGWGIQIAHSGTNLFATWYTYDQTNRQTFFTVANGAFNAGQTAWTGGAIFKPTGSPYNAATYDPSRFAAGSSLGTANFTFTNANNAVFTYTVGGTTRTKNITRFPFSGGSTGSYPSDATDVYFIASQNGWGVSVAQRGANGYFGVIYHYDTDGQPLFFTLTGLSGQLFRTTSTGANFLSATFASGTISANAVGTFTLTPSANGISLSYTIAGRTITNAFTRLLTPPSSGGSTPGTGSANECLNEDLTRNGTTYQFTMVTPSAGARQTNTGRVVAPVACPNGSGFRVDQTSRVVIGGFTADATARACFVRNGLRLATARTDAETVFVNVPFPIPNVAGVTTFDPPKLDRYDLNAGESYTQNYVQTDNSGGTITTSNVTEKRTFVGVESVTVPAGTFRSCRFDIEYTSTIAGTTTTSRTSLWQNASVPSVKVRDSDGRETLLESATVNGRNFP